MSSFEAFLDETISTLSSPRQNESPQLGSALSPSPRLVVVPGNVSTLIDRLRKERQDRLAIVEASVLDSPNPVVTRTESTKDALDQGELISQASRDAGASAALYGDDFEDTGATPEASSYDVEARTPSLPASPKPILGIMDMDATETTPGSARSLLDSLEQPSPPLHAAAPMRQADRESSSSIDNPHTPQESDKDQALPNRHTQWPEDDPPSDQDSLTQPGVPEMMGTIGAMDFNLSNVSLMEPLHEILHDVESSNPDPHEYPVLASLGVDSNTGHAALASLKTASSAGTRVSPGEPLGVTNARQLDQRSSLAGKAPPPRPSAGQFLTTHLGRGRGGRPSKVASAAKPNTERRLLSGRLGQASVLDSKTTRGLALQSGALTRKARKDVSSRVASDSGACGSVSVLSEPWTSSRPAATSESNRISGPAASALSIGAPPEEQQVGTKLAGGIVLPEAKKISDSSDIISPVPGDSISMQSTANLVQSLQKQLERERELRREVAFRNQDRMSSVMHDVGLERNQLLAELDLLKREVYLSRIENGSIENPVAYQPMDIQKQLEEQDQLIQSYQLENERLYQASKHVETKIKARQDSILKENQHLAMENTRLKEQIEALNLRLELPAARPSPTSNQTQDQLVELRLKYEAAIEEKKDLEVANRALTSQINQLKVSMEKDHRREILKLEQTHQEKIEDLLSQMDMLGANRTHGYQGYMSKVRDPGQQQLISDLRMAISGLEQELAKVSRDLQQELKETAKYKLMAAEAEKQVDSLRQSQNSSANVPGRPASSSARGTTPSNARNDDRGPGTSSWQSFQVLQKRVVMLELDLQRSNQLLSVQAEDLEEKYRAILEGYEQQVLALQRRLAAQGQEVHSAQPPALDSQRRDPMDPSKNVESRSNILLQSTRPEQNRLPSRDCVDPRQSSRVNYSTSTSTIGDDITDVTYEGGGGIRQLPDSRLRVALVGDRRSPGQTGPLEPGVPQYKVEQLQQQLTRTKTDLEASREHIRRLSEENTHLKQSIDQERRIHAAEVGSLKADFASTHSASRLNELQSQVACQSITIGLLKDKLAVASVDKDLLQELQDKATESSAMIHQLEQEISRLRASQNPDARRFLRLDEKLARLEAAYEQREKESRSLAARLELDATADVQRVEEKWRRVVQRKNVELDQFRAELDSMLQVLEHMQERSGRSGNAFVVAGHFPQSEPIPKDIS